MDFRRRTKRIFSAALAVWMSGFVVLFCCQMPAKAADAEVGSCPLAKKSNCSKTSAKNIETGSELFFSAETQVFDCCAFPAKIFDKARKLESIAHLPVIAATVEIAAPNILSIEKTFVAPIFARSFIRNRGSTYLRNRVFRI